MGQELTFLITQQKLNIITLGQLCPLPKFLLLIPTKLVSETPTLSITVNNLPLCPFSMPHSAKTKSHLHLVIIYCASWPSLGDLSPQTPPDCKIIELFQLPKKKKKQFIKIVHSRNTIAKKRFSPKHHQSNFLDCWGSSHDLALCLWLSHVPSLGLSFLMYKSKDCTGNI